MTAVLSNELKNLFQVPLLQSNVFLPDKAIASNAKYWCDSLGIKTTFNDNNTWFDQMPAVDTFNTVLNELVNQYFDQTGRQRSHRPLALSAWATVWNEGDVHMAHIHPGSVLSGTYYAYADENSASIVFESPWDAHCMNDPIDTEITRHVHYPRTGDFLLWPSWLRHYVNVQGKQTQQRVAVSFNLGYV